MDEGERIDDLIKKIKSRQEQKIEAARKKKEDEEYHKNNRETVIIEAIRTPLEEAVNRFKRGELSGDVECDFDNGRVYATVGGARYDVYVTMEKLQIAFLTITKHPESARRKNVLGKTRDEIVEFIKTDFLDYIENCYTKGII